ncbi:MAG: alpha/beta hydrolase [Bdellovibrionales bacterium]|nr:alpha/beta hydrolase [Bdellovibrionales bacterium]
MADPRNGGIESCLKSNPIDEYKKIQINGFEQQIWIRGDDVSNPLLLFLHGGPGHPHMHLAGAETDLLVKHFTVVQWDQRGAGASFVEDIDPKSLTIEQMEEDAIVLVKMLLKRFRQKKIYLLGHSWGSYLGIKVVHDDPDLFHAFVAIGLVTDMISGYQEMKKILLDDVAKRISELGTAGDHGNNKELILNARDKLEKFDIKAIVKARDWNGFIKYYFNPRTELGFPYTLKDLKGYNPHISSKKEIHQYNVHVDKGMKLAENLFFDVLSRRLTEEVKELKVPIFTILGRHDYNINPHAAERFMNRLIAPCKHTFWFENSAHMITFEEPERFQKIMLEQVLHLQGCLK